MINNKNKLSGFFTILFLLFTACKIPPIAAVNNHQKLPESYNNNQQNQAFEQIPWRNFFKDSSLLALIDTALANNQELKILLQEIAVDSNEILIRKGEYLPFVHLKAGALTDKSGKYTWNGFNEEDLKANPDKAPKYFGDFSIGAVASWELDVWKKLRNSKKAAVLNYLSSIEGKNFATTQLIAEIAGNYYELKALNQQLNIINQNIALQQNALVVVKLEKEAAKLTQLAVNRFEAQLLNTQNLQFAIRQQIVETENNLNYLVGRFPQAIPVKTDGLEAVLFQPIHAGIPSQLLENRPDIKQAAYLLEAGKINVAVARANFLPSFSLQAGLNLQAYNPLYTFNPASLAYQLGADALMPLVNRNAIKAMYATANAKQNRALISYQQTILNACKEVSNQIAKIDNSTQNYQTKQKEVAILNESVTIANKLFTSARADYIEVLLTQREALDSKMELIDIQLNQIQAIIGLYKSLGGGWK